LFLSCFAILAAAWAFFTFEKITVSPIANELFNSMWQLSEAVTGRNLEQSISVARHQPFFSAGHKSHACCPWSADFCWAETGTRLIFYSRRLQVQFWCMLFTGFLPLLSGQIAQIGL
jgi:hypothetical protein